ncbi:MAG: Transcription termination factor Rho [Candidatus Woesebacteria bacterium]|nr:MAG: Transcription termination factor Rho [Candidatus Woesebacteria bacterium]
MISAYVIQEEVDPKELLLYGDKPVPRTVLVLEKDLRRVLTSFPSDQIIGQSSQAVLVKPDGPTCFWAFDGESVTLPNPYPHYLNPADYADLLKKGDINSDDLKSWGLEVPPPIVKYYNLRMGDKVEVGVEGDLVCITSVNGQKPFSHRPFFDFEVLPEYPQEIIPLDKGGSIAWRMIYLLGAVQGYGQTTYILGEGGLGKTTLILEAWKEVLKLTQDSRICAVLVFVGERGEDLSDYLDLLQNTPHGLVEVWSAPKGVPQEFQWQVFLWGYHRSLVLGAHYHCITFYESASRAVDAFRAVAEPGGGMVTGGIPTEAISRVAAMVGRGGFYPKLGTSNTNIVSVLDGNKSADPLAQFALMTADHNTTSRIRLVPSPQIPFPKISVIPLETYTRRSERLIPEALRKEQEKVKKDCFFDSAGRLLPPEETHRRILKYCEENPDPQY